MENLNVLLSGDVNAEYVLPTLIASVVKNTDRFVHVRILCRGWDRATIETENLKVEFLNKEHDFPNNKTTFCKSINDKTMYMSQIEDWDRCILMDWDNLVIKNLDDYYDTAFDGDEVITGIPSEKYLSQIAWGGAKPSDLLNAEELKGRACPIGGNVVDLKKCRHMGVFDKTEHIINTLEGQDHVALLVIFNDKIKRVDARYNRLLGGQTIRPLEGDVILHYDRGNKPWDILRADNHWSDNYATWGDLSEKKSESIIMVFSKPRSGSTLIVRLLNQCENANGLKVRANGESGVWEPMLDIIAKAKKHFLPNKGAHSNKFVPYFHGGVLSQTTKAMHKMLQAMCGASTGETIAFKEVNYALHSHDYPNKITDTLKLMCDTKVVVLNRSTEAVLKSMKDTNAWWVDDRFTEKSVNSQGFNLSKIKHDVVVSYEELLTYETFKSFAAKLGLTISKKRYQTIISKKLK